MSGLNHNELSTRTLSSEPGSLDLCAQLPELLPELAQLDDSQLKSLSTSTLLKLSEGDPLQPALSASVDTSALPSLGKKSLTTDQLTLDGDALSLPLPLQSKLRLLSREARLLLARCLAEPRLLLCLLADGALRLRTLGASSPLPSPAKA